MCWLPLKGVLRRLSGFDKDGHASGLCGLYSVFSRGQAFATHDNEMKNSGGGNNMSFTIALELTGVMNLCRYVMLFPG